MRRFLFKSVFLISLFIPVGILIVMLAWNVGELQPIASIVQMQQDTPNMLVGRVWQRDEILRYKYSSYTVRQPEIIVMGSSVMREFDERMFPDGHFYNFTIDATKVSESAMIIEQMAQDNQLPNVILLDVNPHTVVQSPRTLLTSDDFSLSQLERFTLLRTKLQIPFQFMLSDGLDVMLPRLQATYTDTEGYLALGMNARFEGKEAFTPDGRMIITRNMAMEARRARDTAAYLQQIANQLETAAPNQRLLPDQLQGLETILQIAQANNIVVVGVGMPIRPELLDYYHDNPELYGYWDEGEALIAARFEAYNLPYLSISTSQSIGGDETEMLDTVHAGKRLTLRVAQALVDAYPDVFAPYANAQALQRLSEQSEHWYYLEPQA